MSTTPTAAQNGEASATPNVVTTEAHRLAPPARVYSPAPLPPSVGKVLARYDSESRIYGFAGMAVQFPRGGESCMFFTSPKEFGTALEEKRAPQLLVSKREYYRLQPFAIHSHKWSNILETFTQGGFWGVLSLYIDTDKRPTVNEEKIFDDWKIPRKAIPIVRPQSHNVYTDGLVMAPDAYEVACGAATPWSLVRQLAFNLRVIQPDSWDHRAGKVIPSPFKDDGREIAGIEELRRPPRSEYRHRGGAFFGGHQAPPLTRAQLEVAAQGFPQGELMASVLARPSAKA